MVYENTRNEMTVTGRYTFVFIAGIQRPLQQACAFAVRFSSIPESLRHDYCFLRVHYWTLKSLTRVVQFRIFRRSLFFFNHIIQAFANYQFQLLRQL